MVHFHSFAIRQSFGLNVRRKLQHLHFEGLRTIDPESSHFRSGAQHPEMQSRNLATGLGFTQHCKMQSRNPSTGLGFTCEMLLLSSHSKHVLRAPLTGVCDVVLSIT